MAVARSPPRVAVRLDNAYALTRCRARLAAAGFVGFGGSALTPTGADPQRPHEAGVNFLLALLARGRGSPATAEKLARLLRICYWLVMPKPTSPTFSTNLEPSAKTPPPPPYRSRRRVLTAGERRFYHDGLLPAVGRRYTVLMKVRLTDVLEVPEGQWRAAAGRRIQQRHVDFLLVTKRALAIAAVVELDDATHLNLKQQQKDSYLADALREAGVPLIRFPVYQRYEPERIRRAIAATIARSRQRDRQKA